MAVPGGMGSPAPEDSMGLDDIVDKAKDLAGDAAEKAKELAEDAKDVAGHVADKAKDVAGDVADHAHDVIHGHDDTPTASGGTGA
jgi:protein involved in temperature-dependent protein secretion